MQSALAMEKTVNQCLLDLHKLAENNGDANVRIILSALSLHSCIICCTEDIGF